MKDYLLKSIVVPFDFSKSSEESINVAIEIADSTDKIEVVHVADNPNTTAPGVIWGAVTEESIETNLQKSFQKSSNQFAWPDLKFTALFGDPGNQICEFAKSCNAGLIVISTHGRTGIQRILIGSVAERVVRLAHCPVLVLRTDSE